MRRHIIPILVFFTLLAVAVFLLLNYSKIFFLRTIPPLVADYLKPFQLQSLEIGQQQYRLPGTLTLTNVRFSLQKGLTQTDFSLDKLVVYNLLDVFKMPRKIRADVRGLKMEGPTLKIHDLDLKLSLLADKKSVQRISGLFDTGSLALKFYHMEKIQGRINGDSKKIELLDVEAKAYGGDVKGQVLMDRGAVHSYIIWAELFGWQPQALKEINAGFFTKMSGGLDGTFRMKNDGDSMQFFTLEFSLAKGGQMSPELVSQIAGQSASLNNQDALEKLLRGKDEIFFDEAKFYLQNTRLAKVMAGAELRNKKEDLYIRALHEIAAPEGIEHFMLEDVTTDIFAK
jgi:hypothetical protein